MRLKVYLLFLFLLIVYRKKYPSLTVFYEFLITLYTSSCVNTRSVCMFCSKVHTSNFKHNRSGERVILLKLNLCISKLYHISSCGFVSSVIDKYYVLSELLRHVAVKLDHNNTRYILELNIRKRYYIAILLVSGNEV